MENNESKIKYIYTPLPTHSFFNVEVAETCCRIKVEMGERERGDNLYQNLFQRTSPYNV